MMRLLRIGVLCAVAWMASQASAMPLGYRLSRQARAAVRQAAESPDPDPTPAPTPTPEPAPEQTPTPTPELWPNAHETAGAEGLVPADAASVYDGFLADANGDVVGTVQVKVAKPKGGKAKVTVVFQPIGGKKTSVKGTLDVATGKVDGIDLTLGADGMVGTLNGYDVSGSRNLFASKSKAEQGEADAVLKRWQGAVNVAWRTDATERVPPYQTLSVNIAKKGKAKVSGTLANGAKVSASSQLIVGEEWCCVPVAYAKKGVNLSFNLWLPLDATGRVPPVATGLGGDVKAGKPGTLKGGAHFHVDAAAFAAMWGQAPLPYLPDGVAVSGGGKWSLPKAGSVAYRNGAVDESKAGENPSGLKLACKAKDGTFKGSFSAYAQDGGKLKKTKVDVTGVLVDGVGYGAATVKKVGGVAVTVE